MSVILNPVEQYFDVDGEPLQNGYLYFGEVYGNPVTQPVMVYFDPDFTIPAAQPVRTVNGYPVRSGTAAGLYAPDDVSILVQNSNREQLIYIQSSQINTGDTTTIYCTSNTQLTADDNNRTFIILSAFTQTFEPAVNLGDRWRVNIINMSGGNVILDPNLSETIDGQSTLTLTPNQAITVYSNGVNLFTNLVSIKLVPDDPYNATTWDGNVAVPTKNALRDKIESIISAYITAASDPTFADNSGNPVAANWVKSVACYNKSWVNVSASRAFDTTYTNTTNLPIDVSIFMINGAASYVTFLVNGSSVQRVGNGAAASAIYGQIYHRVYPGETYQLNNTTGGTNNTLSKWSER